MGTTVKFKILFEIQKFKILLNVGTTAKFKILFEMWELLQSSRFSLKCGNYCTKIFFFTCKYIKIIKIFRQKN
ncbi:hypothetical protein C5473_21195 [Leptospira interrogans serovar Weerasinghe]|nr:hypothetical protein C5473_21195 [Leptospira interrogans serovar Weerasinghe]